MDAREELKMALENADKHHAIFWANVNCNPKKAERAEMMMGAALDLADACRNEMRDNAKFFMFRNI